MNLFAVSFFICLAAAIWPAPQSFTHGTSVVWIQHNFKVTYNGQTVRSSLKFHDSQIQFWKSQTEEFLAVQFPKRYWSSNSSCTSQSIVEAAVRRTHDVIFAEKFVPWKLHLRNEISKFEPSVGATKIFISCLSITQTGTDNSSTFNPLAGQVDESYQLTVETNGTASITAISSIGILRALDTFSQFFYLHSHAGAGVYCNLAPIKIIDSPKFAHRGLNLDVSRNWYPKADLLRVIDAISWNKFNRLHIHMTDGQSWPMDIPALPALSQKGAYQAGLSYSPKDIQDIHTYAMYRGVEVIIEIDMPGHTSAIGLSYPDLITAFEAKPWDTYCAEPPCGQLKLNSPAVSSFLETLLGDILPRVRQFTSYFHTGGDEVNLQAYSLDETVNSSAASIIRPYLQKFVDRNHEQVRAAGLAPIVWEEMAIDWNLDLGDDVVVQTWISDVSLATVTAKGHKALFGNYNFWYLDCGKGQWLDFENGQSFRNFYPFADYCSPTKNWRLIYSYDPTSNLSPEQAALVLGGEIHMWSEQTDPVILDSMLWPRAGAAAEVLWSGRQDASGQNRSQLDASPRLAEMRERMVHRGIRAGPVQMIFCTQHDSSECSL